MVGAQCAGWRGVSDSMSRSRSRSSTDSGPASSLRLGVVETVGDDAAVGRALAEDCRDHGGAAAVVDASRASRCRRSSSTRLMWSSSSASRRWPRRRAARSGRGRRRGCRCPCRPGGTPTDASPARAGRRRPVVDPSASATRSMNGVMAASPRDGRRVPVAHV